MRHARTLGRYEGAFTVLETGALEEALDEETH